jgi:hypothetical protein
VIGWVFVAFALSNAVYGRGWAIGLVLWLAALAVSGFVVTLLLTYRPRALPWLGVVTALAAGATVLVQR